jgi:hypothetical protein
MCHSRSGARYRWDNPRSVGSGDARNKSFVGGNDIHRRMQQHMMEIRKNLT